MYAPDQCKTERSEEVQVRRLADVLDDVCRDISSPKTFVKIDTQGHDMAVLRGLGTRLKDIVGLQIEASVLPIYSECPMMLDYLKFLEANGFQITGMYPVARDERLRVVEFDCIAVRENGATS